MTLTLASVNPGTLVANAPFVATAIPGAPLAPLLPREEWVVWRCNHWSDLDGLGSAVHRVDDLAPTVLVRPDVVANDDIFDLDRAAPGEHWCSSTKARRTRPHLAGVKMLSFFDFPDIVVRRAEACHVTSGDHF